MEDVITADLCQKCAGCCKNFPFVELSEDEIDLLKLSTGLELDIFTNSKGEDGCGEGEGYFLKFSLKGDCFFLKENNGRHSCSVYESRPSVCTNYPTRQKEKETCDAHSLPFR